MMNRMKLKGEVIRPSIENDSEYAVIMRLWQYTHDQIDVLSFRSDNHVNRLKRIELQNQYNLYADMMTDYGIQETHEVTEVSE